MSILFKYILLRKVIEENVTWHFWYFKLNASSFFSEFFVYIYHWGLLACIYALFFNDLLIIYFLYAHEYPCK